MSTRRAKQRQYLVALEKKYHHRAGIHSRWRPKTRHINLSRVEAIKSDHEWRNRKQHHQISRILDKLILWELDHD